MHSFSPTGVCANRIDFKIEDGKIKHVDFIGGCPGNLIGMSQLLVGLSVEDAIQRLDGIPCGARSTSCPDQFAQALKDCC